MNGQIGWTTSVLMLLLSCSAYAGGDVALYAEDGVHLTSTAAEAASLTGRIAPSSVANGCEDDRQVGQKAGRKA